MLETLIERAPRPRRCMSRACSWRASTRMRGARRRRCANTARPWPCSRLHSRRRSALGGGLAARRGNAGRARDRRSRPGRGRTAPASPVDLGIRVRTVAPRPRAAAAASRGHTSTERLALLLAAGLAGSCPGRRRAAAPVFRAGVESVYVDVFVTRGGRPSMGLDASNFELKDKGRLQRPELLAVETLPLTTLLVFDTSDERARARSSTRLRAAAGAFLGGLRPRTRRPHRVRRSKSGGCARPTADKAGGERARWTGCEGEGRDRGLGRAVGGPDRAAHQRALPGRRSSATARTTRAGSMRRGCGRRPRAPTPWCRSSACPRPRPLEEPGRTSRTCGASPRSREGDSGARIPRPVSAMPSAPSSRR